MSENLFEGLGAMFGLLSIKNLEYVKTDNEKNMKIINYFGGPSPYIVCSKTPSFFQKGIKRITNSWAGHAGLFVGEKQANQIRIKHNDLLGLRKLPENEWQGKILKGVPACANENEIIESQSLITTGDFKNAIKEGEQVVVFVRKWSDQQRDAILYAAYYMYSAPYDIFEIGNWLFPFIPNPLALKVCSSFIECALEGERPDIKFGQDYGDIKIHDWLVKNGYDPNKVSPGALGKYLFSDSVYTPICFNCDLEESRTKI